MEDIELVIKISKKTVFALKHKKFDASLVTDEMRKAIANGTPIPKGHGDLIDRRELKKEVYTITEWNGDIHRIIYEASIDDANPIIEADNESEEK